VPRGGEENHLHFFCERVRTAKIGQNSSGQRASSAQEVLHFPHEKKCCTHFPTSLRRLGADGDAGNYATGERAVFGCDPKALSPKTRRTPLSVGPNATPPPPSQSRPPRPPLRRLSPTLPASCGPGR